MYHLSNTYAYFRQKYIHFVNSNMEIKSNYLFTLHQIPVNL